jgi:hypothetical protein
MPHDWGEWSPARALACGAATALLFLARLDALIWVLSFDAILLAAVWRGNRNPRPMLNTVAVVIVTQLVVGIGYFLGNWLAWDHVLPISAAVKAARSPFFALAVPPSLLFLLALGISVIGLAPLAEFCMAVRRRRSHDVWTFAVPAWLGLSNASYLILITAKGGHETFNWYFVLTVFSGAYLLPFGIQRYAPAWNGTSRSTLTRLSVAVCLGLLVVSAHSKLTKPSYFVGAYDKAMALAAYPERSLVLAATDCGILGYFSGQHVMNLDGLTNSWDFQTALATGRLGIWLKERGLNAYVAPPGPDGRIVLIHTRAGLGSAAQTIRVEVEPLKAETGSANGGRVYAVTTFETIEDNSSPFDPDE